MRRIVAPRRCIVVVARWPREATDSQKVKYTEASVAGVLNVNHMMPDAAVFRLHLCCLLSFNHTQDVSNPVPLFGGRIAKLPNIIVHLIRYF